MERRQRLRQKTFRAQIECDAATGGSGSLMNSYWPGGSLGGHYSVQLPAAHARPGTEVTREKTEGQREKTGVGGGGAEALHPFSPLSHVITGLKTEDAQDFFRKQTV